MSEDFPPLTTEAQARDFLREWPSVIASPNGRDLNRVRDAIEGLEDFSYLDVVPFYLACLAHNFAPIRMQVISALADYVQKSKSASLDLLRAIYQVCLTDSVPHVRAAAIGGLAHINRTHELSGMRPWLIGIALNPNEHKHIRLSAYYGLIVLEDRHVPGDPRYMPNPLNSEAPIETRVDWTWLHELKEQYGSGAQLDF